MSDITKCNSEDCPVRDECYRYTAKPSDRQSYFSTPPLKRSVIDGKNIVTCEFYWGDNSELIFKMLNTICK